MQVFDLFIALLTQLCRYNEGAGYNEFRVIQSQNMSHRMYDKIYGVRINAVQVKLLLSIQFCNTQHLIQNKSDRVHLRSGRNHYSCKSHDGIRAPCRLVNGVMRACAFLFVF